jgi:hypothetical protein
MDGGFGIKFAKEAKTRLKDKDKERIRGKKELRKYRIRSWIKDSMENQRTKSEKKIEGLKKP